MEPMNIINKSAVYWPSVQGFVDGQLRQVPPLLLRVVLWPLKVLTLCLCRYLLKIPQMR